MMREERKKIDYNMLESRLCGMMKPLEDALEFFELYLPDSLPEDIKTEEFCDDYQRALNRLKHESLKHLPIKPKLVKLKRFDCHSCGKCGRGLDVNDNYCPACGTKIKWDPIRCLTR